MRFRAVVKKLAAGLLLVAAISIGGTGVAAADGSSWYAETRIK